MAPKQTSQQIHRNRQINQPQPAETAAQNQHRARLHPAGGQRTVFRAFHVGIVFAFEQLIQRRRTTRQKRRSEHRMQQQRKSIGPG